MLYYFTTEISYCGNLNHKWIIFCLKKKQGGKVKIVQEIVVDPSTPASDQNRASPYIINPMPGRQVMTIKISRRGSVVDPLHNSPNSLYNNCMTDIKENY